MPVDGDDEDDRGSSKSADESSVMDVNDIMKDYVENKSIEDQDIVIDLEHDYLAYVKKERGVQSAKGIVY